MLLEFYLNLCNIKNDKDFHYSSESTCPYPITTVTKDSVVPESATTGTKNLVELHDNTYDFKEKIDVDTALGYSEIQNVVIFSTIRLKMDFCVQLKLILII